VEDGMGAEAACGGAWRRRVEGGGGRHATD
jgi:hypothetical protein